MKNVRSLRPFALGMALLLASVSTVETHAQASGSYSSGGSQYFALPSIGTGTGGKGAVTLFEADFNAGAGFDLGCGGVGLFDFMKSTFDLGNIVEEFKGSLNSMLSKALVTFAMSTPQIASLFDTLNAFGNARFDMFNQSCDINQIRADVKQKYMEKCIAEGKAPDQCTNMTGGAQDILEDVKKQFATLIRQAENINEFLRGPMCGGSSGVYNPNDMGCMVMAFMPQFRLCLRSSLGESCPSAGYGARPAPLSVGSLADLSTMGAGQYINNMASAYNSNRMRYLPRHIREQAALDAVTQANNGVEPQGQQALRASSIMPAADSGGSDKTQQLIEEFRKQIACPNEENPFKLVQLYMENVARLTGTTAPTVNTEVDLTYIKDEVGKQILGALKDAYANDVEGVKETLEIGTRCMLVRAAADDPFTWIDITGLDNPGDAVSYNESTANEVGYLLGMEIATFVQNMIKKGIVQLDIDQAAGPALAQAQNAEAAGQDPATFQNAQEEMTDAIREPVKGAANSMIEELENMKKNLTKKYESDKVRLAKRKELKALRNTNYWNARANAK